jgi:hypothetical protein
LPLLFYLKKNNRMKTTFDFDIFFTQYAATENEYEKAKMLVEFNRLYDSLPENEKEVVKAKQVIKAKALIEQTNELLGEKAIA